jgi:hypothetical protein
VSAIIHPSTLAFDDESKSKKRIKMESFSGTDAEFGKS